MKAFQRSWVGTTTIGLLVALLCIGIAGCGYSSVGVGSIPSTASQAQVVQLQPQTAIQHCGIVHSYGVLQPVPIDLGNALKAENCFWQAFQHCRPATLIFLSSTRLRPGIGNTFVRTFAIHNVNGSCSISDARQEGPSARSLSQVTIYACSGLKRFPRALYVVGCGKDGTIIVLGF
jgi:hypothetical protein